MTREGTPHIYCNGSPFQIGEQHGSEAKEQIARSLAFYADYFLAQSGMDWPSAVAVAGRFLPCLDKHCPHLVEEMRGIASGAGVGFEDILALNARTEISMGLGLPSDGCTSVFYRPFGSTRGILGQNWDWETAQQENLIAIHITSNNGFPRLGMITEAGLVGKIGLNESGLGVCLNAIRAQGVNYDALPVHVALRRILESESKDQAIKDLLAVGVATSCYILVADSEDATGLEGSHLDLIPLPSSGGVLTHTNHWLAQHAGPDGPIKDSLYWPDSVPRLLRLNSLIEEDQKNGHTGFVGSTETSTVEGMLEDEQSFPYSINKAVSSTSSVATLFSIAMNLAFRKASVRIGRPTEPVETFTLHVV